MKAISYVEDLKGKTIEKAKMLDNGETFGLLFTDGTYCSIAVSFCGNIHDLKLDDPGELDDWSLVLLGVISRHTYDQLKEAARKKDIMANESRDRAKYEELKARFDVGK